ncbi:hypothetical protein BHM03_00021617 [Ensete ventricosum]|nr:hypothetical protein BHM03_00021617 [Ensete ventricosum]
MHQHLHVPRQTLQQEAPQSRPSQGEHLGGAPHPSVEATIENSYASVSQSTNRSRDVMCLLPEPDVVSSDSTNSVREQLRQVNQRINEVQRDFIRSKEEVGETTKGGSPFAPEILDKPIPSSFRLPTLEPYNGSTDPTEHVAAFRAQMALYNTSNALMCHTFPTTLRGPARMWYSQIKSSSILSFDQFTKEFELNCIASSCPRPTTTSLLGLTQGNDEPLAQFGDSSSTKKAYARSAVEKRPRSSQDPEITFGDGDDAYPDHDDALVISARIDNTRVKRIMVDTGRFTGDSISPARIVVLPVTVGEEPRSKTLLVSFIVVALPSADYAIIGKPTLNKLRAVVSTYHRIMKFPTRAGVQCYLTTTTLPKKLKASPSTHGVRDSSKASPKPEPTEKVPHFQRYAYNSKHHHVSPSPFLTLPLVISYRVHRQCSPQLNDV